MTTLQVGSRTRYTATFRDPDGTPFDGAVVLFKLRSPSGTETTFRHGADAELSRLSAGVYRIEVPWTEPGIWFARWEVLASATETESTLAADERTVQVARSSFAKPILP